jgi:hypothetical protein
MAEDVIPYWLAPSSCIFDFNLVSILSRLSMTPLYCIKRLKQDCQALQALARAAQSAKWLWTAHSRFNSWQGQHFSLHNHIQTLPVTYQMDTRDFLPAGEVASV